MKQKLLIISGQTATGKTNLGVCLAEKFNGEILSFDSRQAYRRLNIITGKISNNQFRIGKTQIKERPLFVYQFNSIPIWLYDLYDPKEYANAYDFCQTAELVMDNIVTRGKLPIIVGGTVFYIKTFLEGLTTGPIAPDWRLRKKLEKLSVKRLQEKLRQINKNRFLMMNDSDRKNKRRLIRAVEIEKSKLKNQTPKRVLIKDKKSYKKLFLALVLEKEEIKQKIEKRVEQRIKQGAIEEIRKLLAAGYSFDDPGLNTLGYKQLKNYFENKSSLSEATSYWIRAEVDYARRQLVFLKKLNRVVFLNPQSENFLEKTEELVYKWNNDQPQN